MTGLVGQRIGPYRLSRQIGEGGYGSVYEAKREEPGEPQRVAIKILHGELSQDPAATQSFLAEARAVSAVQHPGIARVLEMGQTKDGVTYFVMEYLEGMWFSARLAGISRADALRLGRQIASTLTMAHAEGVVHRDLNPDKLVIIPEPEAPGGERVKILAFGMTRLAEEHSNSGAIRMKTRTGVTMGMPQYLSPEQCRGVKKVDAKADVYSLGVLLYVMLVGHPPFDAAGAGEVMAMHQYEPPRPLREVDATISAALSDLVHRMLAKRPTERPTMAEVVAELEREGAPAGTRATLPTIPPTEVGLAPGANAGAECSPLAPPTSPIPAPGRGRWRRLVLAGWFGAGALTLLFTLAVALGPRHLAPPRPKASAQSDALPDLALPQLAPPDLAPPVPVVPAKADSEEPPGAPAKAPPGKGHGKHRAKKGHAAKR